MGAEWSVRPGVASFDAGGDGGLEWKEEETE